MVADSLTQWVNRNFKQLVLAMVPAPVLVLKVKVNIVASLSKRIGRAGRVDPQVA